uniref:hypothetical protein n=1 Tax=Pedobacter schmidteae TaxID=2201271 RepID=UPI000EAFE689|nr:hypothetical protein [Pedobacter schmidteae]
MNKTIIRKYPTETERINARRLTYRRSKRKTRAVSKLKKIQETQKKVFVGNSYVNNIYESIKDLIFGYEGTLRFNRFTSIENAEKAVITFFKRLGSCCENYIYTFEKGEDRNIHIHLALEFSKSFLSKHKDDLSIINYLSIIWNEHKKQGKAWVRELKTVEHKLNYLKYMFKEVLPASTSHFKQKQVDLYYIHSFVNCSTAKIQGKITSLDFKEYANPVIMTNIELFAGTYKHQIISIILLLVWLALI